MSNMNYDLKMKEPADTRRIEVNDPVEVQYWCSVLGISDKELTEAVRLIGHSSYIVKKFLHLID